MNSQKKADGVIYIFYEAVHSLSVGEGDVRDRLRKSCLKLLLIPKADLPDEIIDDYKWFSDSITKFEAQYNEGRMEATLRRIKNSTGRKIADKVFLMYVKLQKIRNQQMY